MGTSREYVPMYFHDR